MGCNVITLPPPNTFRKNMGVMDLCQSHLKAMIYFILFIYFWLCWVFVAEGGLSLVAVSGGYSSSWCMGFSLRWLLLLRSTGSRRAGFSSCGTWAQ